MYSSWFSMALLAMESSGVICLRMMTMSAGGSEAQRESELMVSEKIAASIEATTTLMMGGSLDTVVGRYREQVAANAERLMVSTYGALNGCAAPRLHTP